MLQSLERRKMNGERFHIRKEALTFSTDSIHEILHPDLVCEGSFTIYGPEGRAANGFIISSEPAVRLLTNEFAGARETIAYSVDADGMGLVGGKDAKRSAIEGCFRILSDHGEYQLPYRFECREELPASSLGPVRNLLHFTNVARTNWQEAVQLFYQKEFPEVLCDEKLPEEAPCAGANLETLYRSLSARKGNEHNVEEFLIAAGQKQPVEFRADPSEITVDLGFLQDEADRERQLVKRTIRIRRNGWGYTRLSVSLSGGFMMADQYELQEGSFHECVAELSITIDPLLLHVGRNFGSITLTPAYGRPIRIAVTAAYGVQTALRSLHRREQHEITCLMMQEYLDFRSHQRDTKEFTERMGRLLRRLQDSDRSNPMTALYRIHYLLTVHQDKDALWELQALNRRMSGLDEELPVFSLAQFDLEDDLTYCYRMYLTALCAESTEGQELARRNGENLYGMTQDAARCLSRKQRQNPDNFWIAWLLLHVDSERILRPQETARTLQRQFEMGSRSPILYLEYYQLMQEASGILHELEDFELQTLFFAAKHGLMDENVLSQVNYLALRRKNFSRRLYQILTMSYRDDLTDMLKRDLLESICTLLIRGNMTDPSYFVWYERGVEAGLPITRLLDYYMLSLPEDYKGQLPQMVVRYYAYQNSLPWMQAACLYRHVLENKEAYEEFYDHYAMQIDSFTAEQLLQHRVNGDLVYLYREYLRGSHVLTSEEAAAALSVIFTWSLCIGDGAKDTDEDAEGEHREALAVNAELRRAVVAYDHYLPEQYFMLHGGHAVFPVYGEHNLILLEDDRGDRFAASVPFTAKALMDCAKIAENLSVYETDHFGYDLYRSELGEKFWPLSEGSEPHYQALVQNNELTHAYRRSLQKRLLQYYTESGDTANKARLLQEASPRELSVEERCELLKELAEAGLTEKAYNWVLHYGCDGADGMTLLRIVTGMLTGKTSVSDEELSEIAWQAFQKESYHDELLNYLAKVWDGTTAQLQQLQKAMKGFDLPTDTLGRRILIQLLFTGEYGEGREELLWDATAAGMDTELLADALAQSGHFYFAEHRGMGEKEFDLIGEFGRQGVPLLDICRIAWLLHRSRQSGEITDKALEITELFLSDLLERKIVFPFFRQFIGVLPGLQAYADETLVEYRCGAKETLPKRVLYHYALERGGVRDPYAAREMKEMYEGVYVTGFLLFFGEQMHYYITDDDAEKNIVESGTIGQDARNPSAGGDRFDAINEIAMLAALGRDREALNKLEKYSRKSYLVNKLFGENENAL